MGDSGKDSEVTVFITPEVADPNGNAVHSEKHFIPPDLTNHPYESTKMVEEVGAVERDGTPVKMSNTSRLRCACQNYIGIFLTLTSGFIFTCGGTIVKYMKDFHPVTLAVFRFQGVLLPALCLAFYSHYVKKEQVFSTLWPLTEKEKLKRLIFNCTRGCLGGFALILLFTSIQNLSLADAITINSCRPVFVILAAHVFLREPTGYFPLFTAVLTILGVGVIARPPILTGEESFNRDTLIGCGLAFVGMLAAALSMVVLRYLRGVHVSLVTLGFGFWGTVISGIGSIVIGRFDVPTSGENIFLAFCLAAVTFIAQYMITVAMRYEQAGAVAIVRSSDAVFAFLLQYFVLGTPPDLCSVIGAILITSCVLMIAFRKWLTTLPEKHSARRRYWFVLK